MEGNGGGGRPRRPGGSRALTALGVALCIVLAPVLAVNCALIARSYLDPGEVPGVAGRTPLVVMSDSMYPEIRKGDLIICADVDPAGLGAGDVIAFRDPGAPGDVAIVTHRIVEVTEEGGQPAFLTQGDANDSRDARPTLASDVVGVVRHRLPGLGDVAMFMQSTPGLVVCVALPVLLLVLYDVARTRRLQRRAGADAAELMAELEALRAGRSAPGGDAAGAGKG